MPNESGEEGFPSAGARVVRQRSCCVFYAGEDLGAVSRELQVPPQELEDSVGCFWRAAPAA